MGNKVIIVVRHEAMLSAQVAQVSARSASPVHSALAAYQGRRIALKQLAEDLLRPTPNTTQHAVTALNSVDMAVSFDAEPAAPPSVTVLEGLGVLIVDEDDIDVASLAGVDVLRVWPNMELTLADPAIGQGTAPWHIAHVGQSFQARGAGTLIGVLDTGIDTHHPEFAGKKIHFAEFDMLGRKISTTPRDAGHHGTHVAGIAAGATCGVAPDADLAIAAVLTKKGPTGMSGSLDQIFGGLNWLITQEFRKDTPGVDVVNVSLGVGVAPGGPARSGYNGFLSEVVRNTRLAPGILLIAAIGNDGERGEGFHGSPGNYDSVLAVGAIDRNDEVAAFSDWDRSWRIAGAPASIVKPDLCAPGVDVYSSVPGNAYRPLSGTSMATPVVTGLAAVLLERDPLLRGDPGRLEARLRELATRPVNPAARGGAGRVHL